jgi:leader peptidase (prepilin peptidase) / N-methyltransferase
MIRDQIRVWGTVLAGLLGLAFGSFLNVCLSRWPEGESVVTPRSHCRSCGRVLKWWENVPLVSWVALRGRCRGCGAWIGWRYVIVEAAVGALWAIVGWRLMGPFYDLDLSSTDLPMAILDAACRMAFYWVLVALAFLDFEHLWLPNFLTLPAIGVGFLLTSLQIGLGESQVYLWMRPESAFLFTAFGIVAAAGIVLLIRWVYWLIRRREGIGFGDAKLMALLGAWLGLPEALLAFCIGVVLGAMAAVIILVVPKWRHPSESVGLLKLPLGTFLCIGGIVSGLWGPQIIAGYMRWAGF